MSLHLNLAIEARFFELVTNFSLWLRLEIDWYVEEISANLDHKFYDLSDDVYALRWKNFVKFRSNIYNTS